MQAAAFVHVRGGEESISVLITPYSKVVLIVRRVGTPSKYEPPLTDIQQDWDDWWWACFAMSRAGVTTQIPS